MWIDIVIAALVLIFVIGGYKKGFAKNILFLVSWVATLAGVYIAWKPVKTFLEGCTGFINFIEKSSTALETDLVVSIVAFLLLVIVVKAALNIIFHFIGSVGKAVGLGAVNRLLGAVVGLAKSILVLWIVAAVALPYAYSGAHQELAKACMSSHLLPIINEYNPLMYIY